MRASAQPFAYARTGSEEGSQGKRSSLGGEEPASSSNTGAIVGGIVGGLVVLGVGVAVGVFFVKRDNNMKGKAQTTTASGGDGTAAGPQEVELRDVSLADTENPMMASAGAAPGMNAAHAAI